MTSPKTSYTLGLITFTPNMAEVARLGVGIELALSDQSLEHFLYNQNADYLKERLDTRFAGGGDDVVGMWAPLKPATESIRVAQGYNGPSPINVRTGDMESYLMGDPGVVTGSSDVEWLFPRPGLPTDIQDKLTTAQRGASDPHTQPRPVIGMNQLDAQFLTDEFGIYFAEEVGL